MMYHSTQKDAEPLNTITRIRNILAEAGIFTIEKYWFEDLGCFFSCRVATHGADIGTCGKGTTPELALASAYAEFMERLQNYFLLPRILLSPKDTGAYGFIYEPSEKKMAAQVAPDLPEAFRKSKPFADGESLYEFWSGLKQAAPSVLVSYVPFYEVVESRIEYLPMPFISNAYGSNGMVAGNTPEEALAQGFSEILERFVQRELYFRAIRPPDVPNAFLRDYAPFQYDMIRRIEEAGNYSVVVKDCSLGLGLPVVAVVFFDVDRSRGCVKLGADPDLKIALERCLIELLQGTTLRDLNKVVAIRFDEFDHKNSLANYTELVRTGRARFPTAFFDCRFDHQFKDFPETNFSRMKDRLDAAVKHITQVLPAGGRIYVKDRSYMGFNTYQIVIPGISEAFVISEERKSFVFPLQDPRFTMTRLTEASQDELIQLKGSVELAADADHLGKNAPLSNFFPIPQVDNPDWDKVSLGQFLSMICLRLDDYRGAAVNLGDFIAYVDGVFERLDLKYFHCFHRYLEAIASGRSREDALLMVSSFFSQEVVQMVKEDTANKENAFRYLPLPNCFSCEKCSISATCRYETVRALYLAVKEAARSNAIDQMRLRELLLDAMSEV
jgi:ribosomal protein S12 methylthiotransferase accessory factor